MAKSWRPPRRSASPQETRLRFPRQAVDFCLRQAGTPLAGVDRVVFYDKPFLKFERLLETYLAFAPRESARSAWPCPCGFGKSCSSGNSSAGNCAVWTRAFSPKRLLFAEHHLKSRRQRLLSVSVRRGRDSHHGWRRRMGHHLGGDRTRADIRLTRRFTPSLPSGCFIPPSPITRFQGEFGGIQGDGAGSLWNAPVRAEIYDNLVDVKPDGSFRLNLDFFDYCTGLTMTNEKFDQAVRRSRAPAG